MTSIALGTPISVFPGCRGPPGLCDHRCHSAIAPGAENVQ